MLNTNQTQQLNRLLDTVKKTTADSITDWHQALADEVGAAVNQIQQTTVAAAQASLVQQMGKMLNQQHQAIIDTLQVPLKTLARLAESGHLRDVQKTQILIQLGKTHELLTDWDLALDLLYRGLDYCQEDLPKKADLLKRVARIKTKQQDYSAANSEYRASLAIYSELGDQFQVAQLYVCLGFNDFQGNNYLWAEANYQKALQIAQPLDDAQHLMADIYMNIATLNTVRGNFQDALSYYEQSIEIYEAVDDQRGLAQTHYNKAMLHVDMEAWQQAGESYQKSLEYARGQSNLHLMGHIYLSYTELALKLSDLELAQATSMHAIRTFGRLGSQPQLSEAYKYAGQIQHRRNAWDKAEPFFQRSVELAAACDSRLNEAEAHYEYGLMLLDKPDREKAETQLNDALHLFTALGANVDVQKTQAALARITEAQSEAVPSRRFAPIERKISS